MTVSKQRTVRVSEQTHRFIVDLATETGEPMTSVLEKAVNRYRREQLLKNANEAWAKILDDEQARAEFEAEDALWDRTVGDGLGDDPW